MEEARDNLLPILRLQLKFWETLRKNGADKSFSVTVRSVEMGKSTKKKERGRERAREMEGLKNNLLAKTQCLCDYFCGSGRLR